mmetsp:Transcript_129002/g.306050  ORF Transcript_129002/g.306050 Transcript_129002/m.306050 type:complete len:99 (-) Transcript_129002:7-303(-)
MALRWSALARAARKPAPKPSFGKHAPPPARQPPPPATTPGPSSDQQAGGSGAGGGLMYQILLGMGSMFGVIIAINLVSRLLGPRRITVIHKDSEGRPM